MELDVVALKEQRVRHLEAPIAITLTAADAGGDIIAFPEPFTGTAQAFGTDDGAIAVRFQVRGAVELQCSRCLRAFRQPVALDFTEEFRERRGTGATGELAEDAATGATFVPYQGDQIEVDEVLRQHILLALSMKPLCKEDCLGLCPTCGQDRNEGACRCPEPGAGDPRFRVLKGLQDRPGPR